MAFSQDRGCANVGSVLSQLYGRDTRPHCAAADGLADRIARRFPPHASASSESRQRRIDLEVSSRLCASRQDSGLRVTEVPSLGVYNREGYTTFVDAPLQVEQDKTDSD